MTTITYRDGVMASDSQGTSNGSYMAEREKLHDMHGWLLGSCGASSSIDEFFDWFRNHCKDGKFLKHPMPGYIRHNGDLSYTILLVNKKTRAMYQVCDGEYPFKLHGKYVALGSGMQIAMGAMAMGATAAEAVRIAIRHDCYSGGRVKTKTCFTEKTTTKPLKGR